MKNQRDKAVIEYWLRLYDQLNDFSYRVVEWPDDDSSRENIDALCVDDRAHTLAIEHTLIEPFVGEKRDADRFMKTLGSLEGHPALAHQGYMFFVRQPVGAIPSGVRWSDIAEQLVKQLQGILPGLPLQDSQVTIRAGCEINLRVQKLFMGPDYPGKLFTGRCSSSDPGPELIIRALRNKVPKLAASSAEKKILMLEKDAAAGTIENQFEQVPAEHEIRGLLPSIDEVWSANTAGLERESVLFTNLLWPRFDRATICSLNIQTGGFWRLERESV